LGLDIFTIPLRKRKDLSPHAGKGALIVPSFSTTLFVIEPEG
jgi:hypothetical protein